MNMPVTHEEQNVEIPLLYISWKTKEKPIEKGFPAGRFFIGNNSSAAIHLPDVGRESLLLAFIQIMEQSSILKSLTDLVPIRYNGRLLAVGDSIEITDSAEIIVGKYTLTMKHAAVRQAETRDTPAELAQEVLTEELISDVRKLKKYFSKKLIRRLDVDGFDLSRINTPSTREAVRLKLRGLIAQADLPTEYCPIAPADLEKQVFDEVIGLGPLEDLLADSTVTEIMVNRFDQIFIEKKGKLVLSPVNFSSPEALVAVIERIVSTVGRRVDTSSPIVDARLLDGSRVNAVISPIALKGACLTIRRFSKTPISVDQLIAWKSMSAFVADFLRACVVNRLNIVISGGTGSGKTTLLNALSGFIPSEDRIVTVEDAAELQLQQPHVVSLEARPPNMEGKGAITIRDLVKNCLRMRPDRIVVGECRGGEALDMLQAMNTGHDGSLTTAHANTPEDMLRRLETMVLMAGVDLPLVAIREQVSSAVQMIVQQTRFHSGRRLVTHVTWIRSLDRATNAYATTPIFEFQAHEASDQGQLVLYRQNMLALAKHFEMVQQVQDLFAKHGQSTEQLIVDGDPT